MPKEKNIKIKEYDFSKAKQGAVITSRGRKSRITIRLDADILNWFRAQVHASGGGNYQTLINQALHEHIQRHQKEPLEETLRRIIREELVHKMMNLPKARLSESEADRLANEAKHHSRSTHF